MTVDGPTSIALQVRDLERVAPSSETHLDLRRSAATPPGAVVFDTAPASIAVRELLPGVDLDAAQPSPGLGVALWLHADDARAQRDASAGAGVRVLGEPFDGPVERTSTVTDAAGSAITVHEQA